MRIFSNTAAQSAGPAVGGILIHVFAAPFALFVDAFSYLGSAATLLLVKDSEARVPKEERSTSVASDILDGLRFVFSTGNLGRIALSSATLNMAGSIAQVVSLIFFYRTLGVSPLVLGLLFAFSNVGFLGVMFTPRIEARLGLTGALCAGIMLTFAARALLPMAVFGSPLIISAVALLLSSAAAPLYNIVQLTYRQRITPLPMQARMHATMRTINSASAPVGAAAGGILAGWIGITPTLAVSAILTLCAMLWLVPSPEPAAVNAIARYERSA